MSTTTSTRTFTSCCHQFAAKPTTANINANTTAAPTNNHTTFFPPTKLNAMRRTKATCTPKSPPVLVTALSDELSDGGLGLTLRHKSGRPMRKQVRQAPAAESPFIDSAIASDESDFDLSSDEDIHAMARNRKRKRSPSPPVASVNQAPVSSDSERDNVQSSVSDYTNRQDGSALARATQINISNLSIVLPPGHVGLVTLQINPTSFTSFAGPNGQIPTFYPVSKNTTSTKATPVVTDRKRRTGFLDLPAELRNQIYRLTFVKEERLNFGAPKGFSRSAALLRTCKQVHREGASILYSENQFYFCRRTSRFGSFWEDEWRELGFRSVHSFVKTIGPRNLGLLRHVSFQFDDATPCLNPDSMTHEERRFVNDDILMSTLRHLGQHTRLQQLDLNFHGRRRVERSDGRFLDHLQRIRADLVQFVTYPIGLETTWAMESKQDEAVRKMLLKTMVRKRKMYPSKNGL